jgi:hypothetical protein
MLNGQHFLSFFMEGVKKTDLAGVFKPARPIGIDPFDFKLGPLL